MDDYHKIIKELKVLFPNLNLYNSRKTSEYDESYNCVSWALNIKDYYIWPSTSKRDIWPNDIPRIENQTTFIRFFERYGYKRLPKIDEAHKSGIEKIAIYIDDLNQPTHIARQQLFGKWTSKLGIGIDIEHNTLKALEGPCYGRVAFIMAKQVGL
jgi:hypothetical protein